jgi:hypothetical protein
MSKQSLNVTEQLYFNRGSNRTKQHKPHDTKTTTDDWCFCCFEYKPIRKLLHIIKTNQKLQFHCWEQPTNK